MRLKNFLTVFFIFVAIASFAYADVSVRQGGSVFIHPSGAPLKLEPSRQAKSISYKGIEINLNPQSSYSFNETKTGLKIDMSENSCLKINDAVITNKKNESVLIITFKEGRSKADIQVVSGKVSVKSYGLDNEREISASSSFSIFDVSEIAFVSDGAHYKFEEDLVRPASPSNP